MMLYDFLLGLSVLVFAGVTLTYLRHPAASLLHPATTYLGFHGLVFVVRPILARIYDYQAIYRAYEFHPSLSDKITVILAANFGFLVFMGVCLAVAGQPIVNTLDRFDDIERRAIAKPFMIVALALTPIGLASMFDRWISLSTDLSPMILDRATGIGIHATGTGWFSEADLALVPLTVMFAWLFRFRLWSLLPFATFFLLRAGTGIRGPLVVASLALIMLYLFDHRKRWPEWKTSALLVVVAVTFTFVVADRGRSVREVFIDNTGQVHGAPQTSAPLEAMDFANLEFFEYLVYTVPKHTGTYDYFISNLQIFTEPVPRIWWPDKPVGAPIKRYNLFDYGYPIGITYSVPGAGWTEMGWIGIIIQCGLFAAMYGWLYRRLMTRRQTNLYLFFYVMMVAATIVTYRDGGLLTIARQMPFYVGPIVLIWCLKRVFRIPSTQAMRETVGVLSKAMARRSHAAPPRLTPAERRKLLAAQSASG
jgi:oligosaccharide repeat unit polymerase